MNLELIDVRATVHHELTCRMLRELGYDLAPARRQWIADESLRLMDSIPCCFVDAFSEALHVELMMRGDPHSQYSTSPVISGLLHREKGN